MQLWKAFLSFWCRTGAPFTLFQNCVPVWKQVFLPVFSGFLCFSAVSTRLVWSGINKNLQEALPRRGYSVSQYATLSGSGMHSWGCLLWYNGWVPYYLCWADFCSNGPPLVGRGDQLLLGPVAKSPGERNGEGMQRSILATVVERACMACPAAKCRRQCRLGTGGRQIKRGQGESCFFLRVPFVRYLLLCAHPERKDGHSASVSIRWMHSATACCPAKGQEVWV